MYKCKWLPLMVAVLGGSETFIHGDNRKSCHSLGVWLKGGTGTAALPALVALSLRKRVLSPYTSTMMC